VKFINTIPTPLLGCILLVGLPFFFYGGPSYHSSRSFQAAWDLGHIVFFTLATIWCMSILKSRVKKWSLPSLFFSFFGVVFLIGITIEFIQTYSDSRTPDMLDVARNQLGCLLAFAFFVHTKERSKSPRFLRWMQGTALILLLLALWPLTSAVVDEQIAQHQFPVLADFETPFERERWVNVHQLHQETEIVRHGKHAMRVQLSTNKYSGTSLFYFPGNWAGYHALHCSVYNVQSTPLSLTLRIHDVEHKQHGSRFADRYNKTFVLQPGWNDLVIDLKQVENAPKGRKMDMQHIEGMGLFVVQQAQPVEIILDHVFLAR